MNEAQRQERTGNIFDIQRWSLHDGPGIRTVVFLKGCPLRCRWCSNPESQEFYNELAFFKDKCISCFRCVDNCPYDAISVIDEAISIDRSICEKTCYAKGLHEFPCTRECYSQALRPVANVMSVQDVMKQVMKDELIYRQSEVGGLTVSGGEPLYQAKFTRDLFIAAKKAGITTAIETSGYATWETIEEVLPYIDYFFLDLKTYDDTLHVKYAGVSNQIIYENAPRISAFVAEHGKTMTVRIPVIPDHTELEDFKAMLNFVKEKLDSSVTVEIMAYHRLGRNKYADVGMEYELFDLEPFRKEEIQVFHDTLASYSFPSL